MNRQQQGTRPEASTPGVIIAVMVAAAFVMILNETIVAIALHPLAAAFAVPTATAQWLISGFLLTMAVIIPTTGFLLNTIRPRTMYLIAVGAFAAGSALCASAGTFPLLLAGRVVQASGTAVMMPLVMTTVMRLIPPHRRGSMMGTISIVIGVAPAIGPTTGGAILGLWGWRWMFGLVVGLGLALWALGALFLRIPSTPVPARLPLGSVVLSATGFGALLYGLSRMGTGGGSVPFWTYLALAGVLLAVFVRRQLLLMRRSEPLLDLRTLTYRRYRVGLALSVVVFMALIGAGAILLPVYLQSVLGHEPFTAGIALLPGGLAMAAVSRPAGALYDRYGPRPLVIPGAIGMTASLVLFTALSPQAPLWAPIGAHVLLMFCLGLMMTPVMADALGSLPDALQSHGSALLATLQQVAGALGSAAFVTVAVVFSTVVTAGVPDHRGLRAGFLAATVTGALAIVAAMRLQDPAPAPPPAPAVAAPGRAGDV